MLRSLYRDRRDAGRQLVESLHAYGDIPNPLVLGLPRGGVPVAYEVARGLDAPLDIFLVRKLGVPGRAELAMGAIATGGIVVWNYDVLDDERPSAHSIEAVVADEARELERREHAYRGERPHPQLDDHTVILVDDGLATGASMRAAAQAVRARQPRAVIVAVPVAARETCGQLRREVDNVVCAHTPEPFLAVGLWYEDFAPTTDDEVRALLQLAAAQRSEGAAR